MLRSALKLLYCTFLFYLIRLLDFVTLIDKTSSTSFLFTTVHKSKSGIMYLGLVRWPPIKGMRRTFAINLSMLLICVPYGANWLLRELIFKKGKSEKQLYTECR